MSRTVNLRVSDIESYDIYFTDPKHQAMDVDVGLFFWPDGIRKPRKQQHIWLEIWSRDASQSELETDLEIRPELLAEGWDTTDTDRWIAYHEHTLAQTERRFLRCGSPEFPRQGCRHVVEHWHATTPADRIDVFELHATVTAFMQQVIGWQETNIFHTKFPSLAEQARTWNWYQRVLRGEE